MSETIRCPDCGHENPVGSTSCGRCNFPLPEDAASPAPTPEPEIVIRRPVRRLRPRPALASSAVSLWLLLGAVAAAAVLWTAYTSLRESGPAPIAGATPGQQRVADSLRAEFRRDSTNVDATIAYANVLYDTGNWADAAEHYARAIARDSSRVMAIVDMGVCRYNMGDAIAAHELFLLALRREPNHPVALFNLGIVNERAGEYDEALRYFHRSLESGTTGDMRRQTIEHMRQILQMTGRTPPPLDPGTPPAGAPPAVPGR